MTKDLKISRGVTPRGCGLTFTFEQTHIAKGRSLKKKPDLSLPVCAVVPFLLSNHFWVNHRGIMKTYYPKHVFKCDWFSSLISWFLEKKFIESKWKFSIQKYTLILYLNINLHMRPNLGKIYYHILQYTHTCTIFEKSFQNINKHW